MPHQVFISYASEDFATADRVCRALENTGVTCWIAPRDIPPGTDYPAAIVDGIQNANTLVLLLTDAAVKSPHILSEVGHAFNQRKRIIPFRMSAVALPTDLEYFLSMTQWLDAEEGATGGNLKRLIVAVRDVSGSETKTAERQPRTARKWVVAGFTAALVLSAAGAALWLRTLPVVSKAPPEPSHVTPVPEKEAPPPVKTPAIAKAPPAWVNPADGQTYLWIPPGNFVMGCSPGDDECGPDEKPAHGVKIAQGFWLARTEVTIAAWRAYALKHGLEVPPGDGKLPVTGVAWGDAKKYCAALKGRLPAEAEWEYAARAGVAQSYYGVPSEIAWYVENSGDAPHPVATKAPNAFGLYDMLGNVAEYVLDRYYNKYYLDAPATGPKIEEPLAPNASATARGGFFGGEVAAVRVSRRAAVDNDGPSQAVGFRCVAEHPAP